MVIKSDISNPANIIIVNAGWKHDNMITVSFTNKSAELHLELSEDNFKELMKQGIDHMIKYGYFAGIMNSVLSEYRPIISDYDDCNYYISEYVNENGKIYFKTTDKKRSWD